MQIRGILADQTTIKVATLIMNVTMERFRAAIIGTEEFRTSHDGCCSEQMGFPLRPTGGGEHEEKAEDLDSSQKVRENLFAYHLAPAIIDFVLDKKWPIGVLQQQT